MEAAAVNFATRKATVRFDPALVSVDDLMAAAGKIGYRLASVDPAQDSAEGDAEAKQQKMWLRRVLVAWPLGIVVLVLSLFLMEDPWARWGALILTVPVQFWAGCPFLRTAAVRLRIFQANMDSLISMGTLATAETPRLLPVRRPCARRCNETAWPCASRRPATPSSARSSPSSPPSGRSGRGRRPAPSPSGRGRRSSGPSCSTLTGRQPLRRSHSGPEGHAITATYSGDRDFAPGSAGLTHATLASTRTSLDAAPAPSGFDEALTLVATVTSPALGIPTGVVTFSRNMSPLGTAELDADGVATLSAPPAVPGHQAILAAYAGDAYSPLARPL